MEKFDHRESNMGTQNDGLGPGSHYLDSPQAEDNFLAAIGFQGPTKEGTPNSMTRSEQPHRPQQTNSGTNNTQSPGYDARPQKMPVNSAQPSRAQNQGQSSSQWRRTANEAAPPGMNYWEAQRVAKGIIDPSSYPAAWGQTAQHAVKQWHQHQDEDTTCWRNNQHNAPQRREGEEGPSAARREAAASQPAIARSKPSQTRCSAPDPNEWPMPHEVSPAKSKVTIRLPSRQSRLPDPIFMPHLSGTAKQFPASTKSPSSGTRCGQKAVPNPVQLDQLAPNLAAHPIPRPNRDYAGSNYSLPSLGSGINNDGAAKGKDNSPADIRNSIGLVPTIHASGNSWTKYNWANPTGKDYDEALITPSYLGSFIGAWMKGIPDNVRASFDQGVEEHWKCDIDTITGRLLPPVTTPDAMVDHSRILPELESRRLNWCSELFIQRRNLNPRSRNTDWRPANNGLRSPCSRVKYEGPPIVARSVKLEVCETPKKKIATPEYQRFVPHIPCFLRPAEKFDMEAVRHIYNWEVGHGMQALDSQPLSVEEFEKILGTAQQLGMPFIVAVRGSARDLGLTKGNLAYSPFRQMPFHHKDKRGEILGFGFLSVWQPGLAGSGIGSSRASAKMNVFVHHEYRRKKIGFSLLDMLLTVSSDRFSTQSGYDFVDPDDSPVYKNWRERERQYFRVYSSFLVKHKLRADGNKKLEEEQKAYDRDLAWVKVLHEDMLNFTEMVRLEAVHRSPTGREGPVCWMDEVLFEHACFFDPSQVKEGY